MDRRAHQWYVLILAFYGQCDSFNYFDHDVGLESHCNDDLWSASYVVVSILIDVNILKYPPQSQEIVFNFSRESKSPRSLDSNAASATLENRVRD